MSDTESRPPEQILRQITASRLRTAREKRRLSIRSLARIVGVSPSLISQIETGKANPSVGSLYAIVTVLGISLDELFPDRQESHAGAEIPAATSAGVVLRAHDRPKIDLAGGAHWERLSPRREPDVEFLHVTYDVNGSTCPPDALTTHSGREYGLVLSGQLGATIGFETYHLLPGDSIVLDSTTPHRYWTIGDEPVEIVWIVIGRSGSPHPDF